MRFSLHWVVIVSLCVLPITACGGGNEGSTFVCIKGAGSCFDTALFESNLVAEVSGKTVGFAYAISSGESYYSSGSQGYSRTAADGAQLMGSDQRMNIASITKTITAIAVLQVLDDLGAGLDNSISFFLPSHWSLGPNVNLISFRDLLQQVSGFRDNLGGCGNTVDMTYSVIKATIANGIVEANHGNYCYQNVNFALFRILIPYLRGHTYPGNDTDDAVQTAHKYRDYVIQHVLNPAGATNADGKPGFSTPTLAYPYPDGGINGKNPGDWTLKSGGGGWYLSALEVNRLLRRLLYSQNLLTPALRQEMLDHGLGVQRRNVGSKGLAYRHNGVLLWSNPDTTWGLWTCYYMYPNGVEAVLFFNCEPGPKFINTIMEDAWLAAWE